MWNATTDDVWDERERLGLNKNEQFKQRYLIGMNILCGNNKGKCLQFNGLKNQRYSN